MTITYRDVASALLLTATTISMTFQLYRASVGTNPEVDRFGVEAAVVYAAYFAMALAVRSDRRWVWWTTGLVLTLNLVYGVVGYYPTVYAARPLNVLDWLEGTLYTGLLLAALGCTALRLTGTALAVEPRSMSDAGAPRQFTA
jgi:hypothetical protein